MKRTEPFSRAAIRNASIALALPIALAGTAAFGLHLQAKDLRACNAGKFLACHEVASQDQDKITNQEFINYREVLQLAKDEEKARQVREESERNAKIAEAKHQAEAKFKAEGWFQLEPGIYGRWCTQTCSTAEVIGDQSYWLMEVWAKDRAAGDVYAQINILQNGTIIGWTNDTAYIGKGQRAVLTFGKYGLSNPGQNTAELVKFQARG